ncbi:MAG: hypothetical protein FJ318_10275 [SAR202 cluster bacterium]|nr:hypothetical protein [SAR202 cluster bacterium]
MADRKPDSQNSERIGGNRYRARPSQIMNLLQIPVGAKVYLPDGGVGEVTDNPMDGSWIIVKTIESPEDPSSVGVEEPRFAEDIYGLVEEPAKA